MPSFYCLNICCSTVSIIRRFNFGGFLIQPLIICKRKNLQTLLRLTTTHPFLSAQLCDSWHSVKCCRVPALLRVIQYYLSANKNNCIITYLGRVMEVRYVRSYVYSIITRNNIKQRKCVHAYIKSLCSTSFFDAILDTIRTESRSHPEAAYVNYLQGCVIVKIHFVVQFNNYT